MGSTRRRSRSPGPSAPSDSRTASRKRESIDGYSSKQHSEDVRDPRRPSASGDSRKASPQYIKSDSKAGSRSSRPSGTREPSRRYSEHPLIPSMPTVPAFVSHQQSSERLSLDEQRRVWHDRVDLMFFSITSRRDYTKIEKDLEYIKLLSQSSRVADLPEEDKARINAQRIALELQLETKRKEVNETVQRLMGTEFWPAIKASEFQNLEKTFTDVKKHVSEVKTSLEALQSSCNALLSVHGIATGSTSEPSHDTERPSKRRRMSEEAEAPSSSAGCATPELEAFREQLTGLSRHVSDLENHINQRQQIIQDEVELRINERLEEEGFFSPVEEIQVSQADIEAVVDAHHSVLMKNIQTTESEVGQLAEEVAALIIQRHELEQVCSSVQADNAELKSAVEDLTARAESADPAIINKEVQALNAALQAYISQSPSPADTKLSAEFIIGSLDNEVVHILREKFTPLLLEIRRELIDKVKDSHTQTYNTLFPKVTLLTRMVNIVTARVCQPETEPQAVISAHG
ncbi:hypothetical protein SCLCIDRAFT_537903 [Scleroderma citrinum Foug A]|uniref:Uncharacterized protein n=1 Tax=Scleroderma citrinum Foug A TaxID=1036808 RepID=A0A0C3EAA8_9AGAM|nr:hypothetical protein SCLCIDRAFT_537903 [Scleroderma citrinum Foug A]